MNDVIPHDSDKPVEFSQNNTTPKGGLPKLSQMQQHTKLDQATRTYSLKFRWVFEHHHFVDECVPDMMPNGGLLISEDILLRLDWTLYGPARKAITDALREFEFEMRSNAHNHISPVHTSMLMNDGFRKIHDIVERELTIKD